MADDGAGADAQIDALYGLPLEEFTPARNRLAQKLRRDGDRERSDEVKRLPKPTVAAWTLNQLRRRRPEVVSGLLDAGAQLRQAQERLLGEGERGVLRDAAAHERRFVDEAVEAAAAMLRDTGSPASVALHRKLWETTHAAALDPALGDLLRRGRLLEDRQISDLGLIGGSGRPEPRSSSASHKPTQARRRLQQARERQQKLDEKLAQALRTTELADRQVTGARKELKRAETNAARQRVAAERAREQATTGAERLRELDQPTRDGRGP